MIDRRGIVPRLRGHLTVATYHAAVTHTKNRIGSLLPSPARSEPLPSPARHPGSLGGNVGRTSVVLSPFGTTGAGRDARRWVRSPVGLGRVISAARGEGIADLPIDTSMLREA